MDNFPLVFWTSGRDDRRYTLRSSGVYPRFVRKRQRATFLVRGIPTVLKVDTFFTIFSSIIFSCSNKGQLIRKGFLGWSISSKNERKQVDMRYHSTKGLRLKIFIRFLRELWIPKSPMKLTDL